MGHYCGDYRCGCVFENVERVCRCFWNLCEASVSVLCKMTGRTAWVPVFGGFTRPSVTAFQISPEGGSSSGHRMVKSGESQRTIEEGSSYRIIKLSSLRRLRTGLGDKADSPHVSGIYCCPSGRSSFHCRHRSGVATT